MGLISRIKRDERRNSDPVYKARQKKWSHDYYERHKADVKKRSIKYRNELKKFARKIGHCTYCFKEKKKDKFRLCELCREKLRNDYKRRKNEKIHKN